MRAFLLLSLLLPFCSFSIEVNEKNIDAIKFYEDQAKEQKSWYQFNRYENLISGSAAFLIGNVGYYFSDSSVLQASFSGIQTIGIINIGRSIYQINRPIPNQTYLSLVQDKERMKSISQKELALEFLRNQAMEERAKRLSLFYSTATLSLQYFLNASVYDSPGKIKNVYIFLGGVNLIVAAYSGLYKSPEEESFFGSGFDLSPFGVTWNKTF